VLRRLLQDYYGLATPTLSPVARGAVNRNHRITTADGEYILKEYLPGGNPPSAMRRSCAVQMYLHAKGLPVPLIRPNRDGALLTETQEGYFSVSRFVEGRQYDRPQVPPRAARSMGEALGRLHCALGEMESVQPYAFPPRNAALARVESLLALAGARRQESAVDEAACQILRGKAEALATLAERDLPGPLPAQWVHGDYQETNLIFTSEDQVAAVLDFDNLRCLPRGIEVMRAFAFSFATSAGPAEAAYDFIAGYLSVAAVELAEVERWARDWTYYSLCRDWPIGARYEEPGAYDPRWDRFIVYRPDWWVANHQAVAARLC
jgi:Ser/Thr protein kinase RdoA (MazF antagonist)